jgi:predicted P-loop ATPase
LTATLRWFNRNGFPDATRNIVADAVFATAAQSVIAPVRNYLEALSWDGVERITTWLSVYGGADDLPIIRRMGRAWMISAVARALQPGCKADCALILEGGQGVGKSSAARVLASEDWFSDSLRDLHGKDASAALRGRWIIELPELSAMRRSESEAVKAFLSRTDERYRPPYGRTEVIEPRRCVFIGTTNRTDYLTDDTGNRRFWPVSIKRFDLDALRRDRDQLWAEAVTAFRAGEAWWLDREAETEAAALTSQRQADDPWESKVLEAVIGKAHTSTRAMLDAIGLDPVHRTKADSMRVAGILNRAGWLRDGKYSAGLDRGQARYVPPPSEEPQRGTS